MHKLKFDNKKNPFFKALQRKVDAYFSNENIAQTGNRKLYFKGAFQICTAIALYLILVFLQPDAFLSVILCAVLGGNLAMIGFNIMHEGGHQSFSDVKWVNSASGYLLNVLGGNVFFWKLKHNVNHHTYTNIEGLDDDIELKPLMRFHATQPRYWMHRFQHIYWVLLYGFSYFSWVYINDFVKYFSGKIASGQAYQKLAFKEHFVFWFTKVAYTLVFIGLPIYFVGWAQTLIGYGVMTFVCGLIIGIVFQMAHVLEDTSFPVPNAETLHIEEEWAIHQIQTTANFGTHNKLLSWVLGGLNFQVEHHLFPQISHVHYPAINTFVKETCAEFNISYLEYQTMAGAFWSHLKHIRKMGMAY